MNLRIDARPCLRSSRGQSLVEFAIILPVILLIVLGIIDFGRAYNYKNDQTSLANQAVRYAEVNDCPRVYDGRHRKIQSFVPTTADSGELQHGNNGLGIQTPGVQVSFYLPSGTGKAGDPITAVAKSSYRWFPSLGLGISAIGIVSTATGRLETDYIAPPAHRLHRRLIRLTPWTHNPHAIPDILREQQIV